MSAWFWLAVGCAGTFFGITAACCLYVLRLVVRTPGTASERPQPASRVPAQQRHEFWPDNASRDDISVAGIVGRRQAADS
jgi:hypothetical protein